MDTPSQTFTVVFDNVLDDTDSTTALIHGVMHRYSKMASGFCTASINKIAKTSGTSAATVKRAITTLKKVGYIEQLNSGESGGTNKYRVMLKK